LKKLLGTDDLADKAVVALSRAVRRDRSVREPGLPRYRGDAICRRQLRRRLFVATSKPGIYAERIIDHFKLTVYFERVFGSELDGTRSDKTDLLGYALRTTGVDPSQAIMIGDRSHDMIGARNNKMTAVGVLNGYGGKQELLDAGAHHICATPQGLPGLVS
jgi:phosphoglycolate phosphatase